MSTVTPFSYIDYYFHKLGINTTLLRALLSRVNEIILATMRGVLFFDTDLSKVFSTKNRASQPSSSTNLIALMRFFLINL